MKTKEERFKDAVNTFEVEMKDIGASFLLAAMTKADIGVGHIHVCTASGKVSETSFALYKGMEVSPEIEASVNASSYKFFTDKKNRHAGN